jgi:hypothetical protein
MEKKIEKSIKQLERVNQWIANCDTKTSFLLTFYGVIITVIFSSKLLADILKTLSLHRVKEIRVHNVILFISYISVLLFLFSIAKILYHILYTLKGRIDIPVDKQNGLNTNSLLFFGKIASKEFKKFEIEHDAQSESEYLNDLNSQVYINSVISFLKFKHYNKSLRWIIISLCSFLIYALTKG